MLEWPSLIEELIVETAFAFAVSLLGLPAAWPLLRGLQGLRQPLQLGILEFAPLCLMVGALCLVVPNLSMWGTLPWKMLYTAPPCVVAVSWWTLLAMASNATGKKTWLRRLALHLLVLPVGFVAPYFAGMITMDLFWKIGPAIATTGEAIFLAAWAFVYIGLLFGMWMSQVFPQRSVADQLAVKAPAAVHVNADLK